ncbi:MAG: CBS and ACT domain-containing protein [Chloroflexi bacterium]|nr:CBS and ACT domain-containing protein [Chloroflexota bacterium]
MIVREVMTTNVITIPSSTSLAEARRVMDFHKLRRLPVVDKSKLVGMVSRDRLDRMGPSKLTTFSIHEMSHLLSKITVKEVMSTSLFTVSPDATVEEAVATGQEKQMGSVLVVEDGVLLGIATTNDFFYKIVNPLLGIGKSGSRIMVHGCGQPAEVAKVLSTIAGLGIRLVTMFILPHPETGVQDLTVHLDVEDASSVMEELKKQGYDVHPRTRY